MPCTCNATKAPGSGMARMGLRAGGRDGAGQGIPEWGPGGPGVAQEWLWGIVVVISLFLISGKM